MNFEFAEIAERFLIERLTEVTGGKANEVQGGFRKGKGSLK